MREKNADFSSSNENNKNQFKDKLMKILSHSFKN